MIRASSYTVIDKLYLLWLLLMIADHQDDQYELSPKAMGDKFGEEMIAINLFYMEELRERKLIVEEYQLDTKRYKIKLAANGQKLVSNWRRIQTDLLEI